MLLWSEMNIFVMPTKITKISKNFKNYVDNDSNKEKNYRKCLQIHIPMKVY